MADKVRYEDCGRALMDALQSLPKHDPLYVWVVESSLFKALVLDDPDDQEWCVPYEPISLYETRYTLLANMVQGLLGFRDNDDNFEVLVQGVLQAENDVSIEGDREALFLAIKHQLPELSDQEIEVRMQDFLTRQEARIESFLRQLAESPEDVQSTIDRAILELHESMRRDRL